MSVYEHPVVGTITVVRSSRARRVSLSVRPGDEVRLTLPYGVSRNEALRFVEQKQEWILRARERLRRRAPRPEIIAMPFATRAHVLRLLPGGEAVCVRIREREIEVRYPAELDFGSAEVQRAIRSGAEEAWRREAQAYLPGRVEQLARSAGLSCGKVTVRNSRTRWGSCSSADNISLSLHLMRLPDRLVDYVILHELCHTVHKNHGPRFHELLDRLTGGRHRSLQRELRNCTTRW